MAAEQHRDIRFIAVSHSDRTATDHWLDALSGPGTVEVLVDDKREIYAQWGLGISGWGHIFNLGGPWSALKLGKEEGIWSKPTESGSRWQTAGRWAVDGEGIVRWGRADASAAEMPDFEKAVAALKETEK